MSNINPQQSNVYPITISSSFSERHPKVAQALAVSVLVVGVLAFLVLLSFALVAGFGVSLPILGGVLGGLATTAIIASIAYTVRAKKLAKEKSLEKETLTHRSTPPEIRYALGDQEALWGPYDKIVDEFEKLNLRLANPEEEILRVGGEHGTLKTLHHLGLQYDLTLQLLRARQELYRSDNTSHLRNDALFLKNKALGDLCKHITQGLQKCGGAFALRIRGLSPQMQKISYLAMAVIVLVGLAAVGTAIALVPAGPMAIPLLVVIAINVGLAVVLMSYVVRMLLKQSEKNKRQLHKMLSSSINFHSLQVVAGQQKELLDILKRSILSEMKLVIAENRAYKALEEEENLLSYLQEEMREVRFILKHETEVSERRVKALRRRAGIVKKERDDEDVFNEILKKGREEAEKRRIRAPALGVSQYAHHFEDGEELFGSAWQSKGKDLLSVPPISSGDLSREDSILVEEGIDYGLKRVEQRMVALQKKIDATKEKIDTLRGSQASARERSNNMSTFYATLVEEVTALIEHLDAMYSLFFYRHLFRNEEQD